WRPERLETLDGRQFRVHSPGQWNRQAGPDFLQAVLEYSDGERCRGDVEVHRLASGWTAHRHHQDTRYNRVMLHVMLRNDRTSHGVERADGQMIPQVALEPLLPRPLTAYRDEIPLEDYPNKHAPRIGQCYTTLRALPVHDVQRFLERAGEARLKQRMRRWSQRVSAVGPAQAMYEAVFRSLGSAGYGQRFLDIARCLSWRACQQILSEGGAADRAVVADALLFGISGILQQTLENAHMVDDETQVYLSTLYDAWTHLPGEIQRLAGSQIDWRHPHVRPMNTPERRLAAMAQLLAQYGDTDLYRAALALSQTSREQKQVCNTRSLNRRLIDMFELPAHAYWGTRSRFGSRPGRLSQRLIGRQRALTIVVDAMLPVLLYGASAQGDAGLQQLLLTSYRTAPRLPDNTILRDMSRRLLGDDPQLLTLVTHARHQQGMLQVFEDYCSHNEGECQGCGFPQL
ncbi:MAG: hypothetical protein ETSY2_10575, partial [Candidatus Entotheonella gemina]